MNQRDYPVLNDIPANLTAALVASKGVHFEGKYKPKEWRGEAPLPTLPAPAMVADFVGRLCGRLTCLGYLGKGKWLMRCVCGYYVRRSTKFVAAGRKDQCEECSYRAHIVRRRHFDRAGQWLPRHGEEMPRNETGNASAA